MKKITNAKQLLKLKNGTIILQLYHFKSKDKSKFDINKKFKDEIILISEVGGNKKYTYSGSITKIKNIRFTKMTLLYVADKEIQKLYKRNKKGICGRCGGEL